eukprot:gene32721-29559_t
MCHRAAPLRPPVRSVFASPDARESLAQARFPSFILPVALY